MPPSIPHVAIPADCVSVCARALKFYEDEFSSFMKTPPELIEPAVRSSLEKELADIRTAQAMLARALPVNDVEPQ